VKKYSGAYHLLEEGNSLSGVWISRQFIEIFKSVTNTSLAEPIENSCTTLLQPFLNDVAFYIYKEDPTASISFNVASSNQAYTIEKSKTEQSGMQMVDAPTDEGVYSGEVYAFQRPLPGEWQISGSAGCSQYSLYYLSHPATRLQAVTPTEAEAFPQYYVPSQPEQTYDPDPAHQYHLEVALLDTAEKPITQFQDYRANVNGRVKLPNGLIVTLTFTYDETQKVWRSNEPLPVLQKGEAAWEVTVKVPSLTSANAGETNWRELPKLTGTYQVSEVTPFTVQLNLLQQDFNLHGDFSSENLQVKNIPVQVQFFDNDGQKIEHTALQLQEPDQTISVTLTHNATREYEQAWLRPSISDPYIFEGTIGTGVEQAGQYTLKVSFAGQYNNHMYRLVTAEDVDQITRQDAWYNNPTFYRWLWTSLAALGMLALLMLLWIFSNPVTGVLEFYRVGARGEQLHPFAILRLGRWHRRQVRYRQKDIARLLTSGSRLVRHIKEINTHMGKAHNKDVAVNVELSFEPTADQNTKEAGKNIQLSETDQAKIPGGIYLRYRKS
jgi:hypothetical protein